MPSKHNQQGRLIMRIQSLKRLALASLIGAAPLFSGSAVAEDFLDRASKSSVAAGGLASGAFILSVAGGSAALAAGHIIFEGWTADQAVKMSMDAVDDLGWLALPVGAVSAACHAVFSARNKNKG